MTGSSFAIAVHDKARTLNPEIACWKFFKAQVDSSDFCDLKTRLSALLYNGQKTNSVFPMMTDLLPINGTFIAMIMAEDMYHIDYLQESLHLLGVTIA